MKILPLNDMNRRGPIWQGLLFGPLYQRYAYGINDSYQYLKDIKWSQIKSLRKELWHYERSKAGWAGLIILDRNN